MNEAHVHPTGDERCLGPGNGPQQRQIRLRVGLGLRIMTIDHVVGEQSNSLDVVARGEVLKRAHAHEARGHARQYRSRQRFFPEHRLAGGDRGKRARGRNAERVHGLADDIFAQYRTERGAPVAVP